MTRRHPRPTRTHTLLPYTTLFRAPRSRRRGPRPTGHRGHGRRHRRRDARRPHGGRRFREAVPGDGEPRRAARRPRPGAGRPLRQGRGGGGRLMAADVTLRPRRSVLYMPGANERALEKAQTIPADALILDLEDAVAPDAKPEARDRVCAAASSGAYGRREIAIRANGIGTPWHDEDLRAIAADRKSTRLNSSH